ncbi:MAG: 50S ribosomal protein L17 [Pseudomonadota bacterium]
MRHGIRGRKLGRVSSHRRALLANLAGSLIEHEHMVTTLPKAKELRPFAEKLVTLGKKGTLHARRQAISVLGNSDNIKKLMGPLAERFKIRPGGYTRIVKAGNRQGDNAPMAVIQFVDFDFEAREKQRIKAREEAAEKAQTKAPKDPAGDAAK